MVALLCSRAESVEEGEKKRIDQTASPRIPRRKKRKKFYVIDEKRA